MCTILHSSSRIMLARAFRGCALPLLLAVIVQLFASGSGLLLSLPSVTNETETTHVQRFPSSSEDSGM